MHMDVVELRDFYESHMGMMARHHVRRIIRDVWPDVEGEIIAGYGFATPYMRPFKAEAERLLAFMPAAQGVVFWPPEGPYCTALVEHLDLPLPDQSVDRMIVAHTLEMAQSPVDVLAELWRVIQDGGRLLAIVPSRSGLWARFDNSPFGHGRPFSVSQVNRLLCQTGFTPQASYDALIMPPISGRLALKASPAFEKIGGWIGKPLAGVHIVEAKKDRIVPVKTEKARRFAIQMRPVFAPNTATPMQNAKDWGKARPGLNASGQRRPEMRKDWSL